MKKFIYIALASSVAAFANAEIPAWHPPTKGEVRSPCPGINVLANHDILPRSGKNLERQVVVDALSKWYNIDVAISTGLFEMAVNFSGHAGASSFDMVDIWIHHNATVNAIEGDASFSTVWKQTRSFWQGKTIDVQEFGNAAQARYLTSNATNPTFYFPDVQNIGAAMAFMTSVLGDPVAGTVPTRFVDDWIVNERLPARLGWSTNEKLTDLATLGDLGAKNSGKFFHAGGHF
ncbi:hypothetical protein GRF29_44g758836 [Pseudopithomyces chartarum]|uniref:Heme haloperoxidase family profile domain-containing protein n=1 Tax=Pseudopithomyces chartarum TaxID=1892770 RepID=A0AAN6LZ44_9PLEO|nr:hypothetical protein GRF29_44g758836 [Pseudopithomyces chartarum]